MKKWQLDRRACLRGAGAALGLPALEAMLPGMKRARAAGSTSTPRRLVFFVFQGGTPDTTDTGAYAEGAPGSFWPKTPGTGYEITEILQPLADLKKDILVVRNLNTVPYPLTLDHDGQWASILTGVRTIQPEGSIVTGAGISVDQFAANELKKTNPALAALPSLFLSHPHTGDLDRTLMSWTNSKSRAYPIVQPSQVFRELFGDTTVDASTVRKRLNFRQSILHHAKADADRLKKKLGTADQQTLATYFDSIASLEERLNASGSSNGLCTTPPSPPADSEVIDLASPDQTADVNYYSHHQVDMPSHYQKMSDLVTLAFQCDRTRVVALQAMTSVRFTWLDAPYYFPDYHGDYQHGQNAENHDEEARRVRLPAYVKGSASLIAMFGDLVRKLKNTPEGDGSGSLLDNTILVCTSEMSYGNGHSGRNLPVIVAGGKNLGVSLGRHIVVPQAGGAPIANVYVSMLRAAGIDVASFGESTGALSLS